MVENNSIARMCLVDILIEITNTCEKNIRMNVAIIPTPVHDKIMSVRSILVKICGNTPILDFLDVAEDLLDALDYLKTYTLKAHLTITAEFYSLAFHNTLTYYNSLVD